MYSSGMKNRYIKVTNLKKVKRKIMKNFTLLFYIYIYIRIW